MRDPTVDRFDQPALQQNVAVPEVDGTDAPAFQSCRKRL
jgi:hypothetical protein